ncbi:hypothetical protein CFC21_070569 [Triticum aestivum]|uniref:Uncharacterized protein n=3 Tax=Triticum TaxID=4564 RepID=A0A9R0X2G5_TRITD|nr:uncharacterized protein LOC119307957 [Triticum dicoccoides]XP_044387454.1 uncharacterized protein LOC123110883 [Triticum aestivum]KAF7064167.1 hypothetical protein CFC21_070569 [Triticum aestivum]VAI28822.1 unnamed protein product [Triticum turgidum subsp. durum]
MEKKHMKMAILRQEQTFRQQVHELHRVYEVQKRLMKEMQAVKMSPAQGREDTQPESMMDTDRPQWYINSGEKTARFTEDFNLELTLATGGDTRKQEMTSNSESGATVTSSTSAESESGQRFPESNVDLRFQHESKRHDQLTQSPWLYQCLSLKMA